MNIWGIDMGHPDNCGAFGFMSETDGNRAVGRILMANLIALGDKVIDCTVYDNNNELERRVDKANAQKIDYFISLHLDSYSDPNSNGVTIYTTEGSSAKEKAREVINLAAASCGYHNRGLKFANFYVLKNTNAPAMLIEMGFVSNQWDCNKFNAKSLADAITKGLTGQTVNSTNNNIKVAEEMVVRTFSDTWYLDSNQDVRASGMHPLAHYNQYGKAEGRKPLPPVPEGFTEAGYLICNADVAHSVNIGRYCSGTDHFYEYGWRENRKFVYTAPKDQSKEVEELKKQLTAANNTVVDDSKKETFYRVVTGSYKERPNADEQIAKLKSSGFESFVDIFKK